MYCLLQLCDKNIYVLIMPIMRPLSEIKKLYTELITTYNFQTFVHSDKIDPSSFRRVRYTEELSELKTRKYLPTLYEITILVL